MQKIVALILAGGASRRMGGGVKALLPFGEGTLLSHVTARLLPQLPQAHQISHINHIAISGNSDALALKNALRAGLSMAQCQQNHHAPLSPSLRHEISVHADLRRDNAGPLAGVEAVLTAIDAPWFVTVPTDTPWIPGDLVARLTAQMSEADPRIIVARSDGRLHPVVGLWPRTILPEVTRALDRGHNAIYWWFKEMPHRVVDFELDAKGRDPFFNINTLQDFEWAREWIAREADQ